MTAEPYPQLRIDHIQIFLIELPLKAPFETSFGVIRQRRLILVRVDAGGVTGWGEASPLNDPVYTAETPETAWHILHDYLVPAVVGTRFARPEDVLAPLRTVRGNAFARAGLEMAVWDLFARAGGCRWRACSAGYGSESRLASASASNRRRPIWSGSSRATLPRATGE